MSPGEAEYLGLAGSEALQESFTGSIGSGTGGLEQAPPSSQVNRLIASAGVADGGSGAPGAATAPRLSTFGEEEQAAESEAETVDVAVIPVDQQADAQRRIVEDGLVEPPVDLLRDSLVGVEFPNFFGAQYNNFGDDASSSILIEDDYFVSPFTFFSKNYRR
jgi:hypothetical protein